MKVAVLFRGPVRPNNQSVLDRVSEFLGQFNGSNCEIDTYLATWRYHKDIRASDLISLDLFDNVIMQTEPTRDQVRRATQIDALKNTSAIQFVYNMYYQSKTALDLIYNAKDYDYIIHTRTDIQLLLVPHLHEWFDPEHYVALHVPDVPHQHDMKSWMNDQFGVAPAKIMHQAWNYGTMQNLGRLLELADIPERVLQRNMDEKGIKYRTAPYTIWQLDPLRNS